MNNILTLNKISKNGLDRFGERYVCSNDVKDSDAILVRSASMHEYDFSENTLAIARAGAGVNNIPLEKCSEQGIVVFNTPGANANAVKELVLCALFLSSRKIVPAIEWSKTLKGEGDAVSKLVEKGKSAFSGPEIKGSGVLYGTGKLPCRINRKKRIVTVNFHSERMSCVCYKHPDCAKTDNAELFTLDFRS